MMKFQEAGSKKQEAENRKQEIGSRKQEAGCRGTLCLDCGNPRQLFLTLDVCSLPDFATCIFLGVLLQATSGRAFRECPPWMTAWTVQDYMGLTYNHHHCATLAPQNRFLPPCFQLVTHTGPFSGVSSTFHFLPSLRDLLSVPDEGRWWPADIRGHSHFTVLLCRPACTLHAHDLIFIMQQAMVHQILCYYTLGSWFFFWKLHILTNFQWTA